MSTNKLQKFSERLKARRNHVGFTVEQLARLAQISERSLWGYEKGSNTPDGETLVRLCDALTCDIGWLFGEDEIQTPLQYPPHQDEFGVMNEQLIELKESDPRAFATVKTMIESVHAQATQTAPAKPLTPARGAKRNDPAFLKTLASAHPLRSEVSVREPKAASPTGNKPAPRPRTSPRPSTPPPAPAPAPTEP